jgi:hypothetical protein
MWKIPTPVIAPALRLRSARRHPPDAGEHILPFGSTVFSFAAPAHQRGPLKSEFAGAPLILARPHEAVRQVPDALSESCGKSA